MPSNHLKKNFMKTVAVIGCGKAIEGKEGWAIGHNHAEGYRTCGHEVKLLGVDLSSENLKAFGEKFKLPADQLFNSTEALYAACLPDCVSICTWPALHHPMVVEALEKGVKGIACEKPFTMDVGEQRDLERRVAAAGAVLVVAHQRRLEASFKALKEVVLSGKLGARLELRGHVGDNWDILSWTTHWFDMANFIFDRLPESILAGMEIGDTRRYQHAVEDASIIYADYGKNGSATFLTGPGDGASFTAQGSEGMARIGDGVIEIARFDGGTTVAFDQSAPGGFSCLLKELLAALGGGPEPMCSIRRSAVATEMAYAAHESARTCRRIRLPLEVEYAPLEVAQYPFRSGLEGKRILLHADTHFESGGREGIAEALSELARNPIKIVDADSAGLAAADVEGIDAILIYHTRTEASAETQRVLSAWVAEGKPLLIVHAGLGAWPEWSDYTGWCGYVWDWKASEHPHEPAVLKVCDEAALSFGWSGAWLPKDEVFVKLRETSPVRIGLTAEISTGTFPAAWQHATLPHVGAWMPGHRRDSWKVPAMREGLCRMLLALIASAR